MAGNDNRTREGETGFDPMERDLQCFLNQPNINMVLPWLYDIYKNMPRPKSRGARGEQEDRTEKDLQCFLNQPNINMAIPWIYGIYRSVKEGGGGDGDEVTWDDITDRGQEEEEGV